MMSQFWFAGAIELVGGILIAIGLLTSIVAFIASGEMAVAYFQAHAPKGLNPLLNRRGAGGPVLLPLSLRRRARWRRVVGRQTLMR